MTGIEQLKFDAQGLIPCVVQDYYTKKVLTVAYMNRESLEISMKEGRTCFWSRSRQELWRKGETSGNVQKIVSIKAARPVTPGREAAFLTPSTRARRKVPSRWTRCTT